MKKQFLLFCFLACSLLFLQSGNAQVFQYTYGSDGKIDLNHSWKFHAGDDPQWSAYNFDDSKWDTLNTEMNLKKMPRGKFTGIGWFRIHFRIDSALTAEKPLSLLIDQSGASEIYVDGNKVAAFGKISTDAKDEIRSDPGGVPVLLNLVPGREHVIAIRYSNHEMDYGFTDNDLKRAGFSALLVPA
ncbi:MAG TPA: hypothetical protein VFJ43_07685, partial [Bacteroidia bacterium]|nr:hypothetical protein [Bacteroidia bacterium]